MTKRFQLFLLFGIVVLHAALAILISRYSLTYIPNSGDEHSIAFQAKVFSLFRAAADAPPFPDRFRCHYMEIKKDKWFSQYAPVYSLMISPGFLLGDPGAMAALYSSLSILALFFVLKLVFQNSRDLEIILFCFFFAICPTFLFHSASYYNHIGALFVYLLILYCHFSFRESKRAGKLAWMSLLFGVGVGIRPYTFFLLALPLGLKLIPELVKADRLKRALALALPFCLILFILLVYNHHLTSNWSEIAYLSAGNNYQKLSFEHFNIESFKRVAYMVNDTNKWLFSFGWFEAGHLKGERDNDVNLSNILSGLAFAYLVFRTFFRKPANSPEKDFWEISLYSIVLMVLGHVFYKYSGGRFGERFFFEVQWVVLLSFVFLIFDVLCLAGLTKAKRVAPIAAVLFFMLPAAVWYSPQTAVFLRQDNLRRFDLFSITESKSFHNAVVHVVSTPDFGPAFYARNNPDLSGTIYMIFRVGDLGKVTEYYADKDHYVYQYDRELKRTKLTSLADFMASFTKGKKQRR